MTVCDLASGVIDGPGIIHAAKYVRDLAGYFDDGTEYERFGDLLVYETYASTGEGLLFGTTILHPGRVGAQHFMTRGHFHLRPDRGETVLTLSGSGELRLMSRDGERRSEPMRSGSLHVIDGAWAHRVVNTGSEPLLFYVTWMADCGHDYDSITRDSF